MKKSKKVKKTGLSIRAIMYIGKIYNAVNKTRKQYGEMVYIVENAKAEKCVCCGAEIPEGRMVCPDCERKAAGA